jgi:hypothetical protein
MKYALLLCAGLCISALSHSQDVKKYDNEASIKVNTHGNQKFDNHGNTLKVSLIKDSLFVTDKDILVPVANIQALDSLMKKLPNPETFTIEFETVNAEPEKIRSIEAVLKKYRSHVRKHSISFNKQ